jgi:hypothetical protein
LVVATSHRAGGRDGVGISTARRRIRPLIGDVRCRLSRDGR